MPFKRKMLALLVCFSASILSVAALYFYSEEFNKSKNHFIRFLPSHVVGSMRTIDLVFDSYYIAGLTDKYIYLGNTTAPTYLLRVDYQLRDSQVFNLDLPNRFSRESLGNKISVDSSFVYVTNNKNGWYYCELPDNHFFTNNFHSQNIYTSLPLSRQSIVLKTWDSSFAKNILVKESNPPSSSVSAPGVLEKQIDGVFCTDGLFDFNRDFSRLFYVYYYRNQFICTDTNLTVIYRATTIDTTAYAQIKIQKVSHNKTMLSAPPHIVNRYLCSSGPYVFICSPQKAQNEDYSIFQLSDVIDVYRLSNGNYVSSFYLPRYNGNRLHDFKIQKKHAVALNGTFLSTYTLQF